jgi:hypothetical protein
MLLRVIERHMRLTGMSPSRFGREAMGDPAFVEDLRMGRKPRQTLDRVRKDLEDQSLPAGASPASDLTVMFCGAPPPSGEAMLR